jgi:allantoinase
MSGTFVGVLPAHGRFAYRPIIGRPDFHWPGGARLAVYLGFNIEHFAFGEGLGANLGPVSPPPDVLNYSWREYGNRVGAWRCLELFDQLGLPAGIVLNTALYDHAPELVAACVARGDEIIGHGHTNAERQGGLSEADERALIERCRPGSRRASRRRTCSPRRAFATASTGATTTSRCACAPAAASRCGRCRIRRS